MRVITAKVSSVRAHLRCAGRDVSSEQGGAEPGVSYNQRPIQITAFDPYPTYKGLGHVANTRHNRLVHRRVA